MSHGGQVYLDGANLNALVGLARPGDIGADVSHLNLHKTFCIPHGGGGPGMGPIGVKAHLAPHLPGHPGDRRAERVRSRPRPMARPRSCRSPGPMCLMMGGEGLTQATKVAILNANYIAKRLKAPMTCSSPGRNGRVAHECILDTRPFAERRDHRRRHRQAADGLRLPRADHELAGGRHADDRADRIETKAELDRFCDAMLAIREEIRDRGRRWTARTTRSRTRRTRWRTSCGDWDRPYSREQGCFPPGAFRVDKYWPPVNRVDNAYGDRTSSAPARRLRTISMPRMRAMTKAVSLALCAVAGAGADSTSARQRTIAFTCFMTIPVWAKGDGHRPARVA
jgi:glycine dehydrogenase